MSLDDHKNSKASHQDITKGKGETQVWEKRLCCSRLLIVLARYSCAMVQSKHFAHLLACKHSSIPLFVAMTLTGRGFPLRSSSLEFHLRQGIVGFSHKEKASCHKLHVLSFKVITMEDTLKIHG